MKLPQPKLKAEKRWPYQKPRIIYAEVLKTRAGSPLKRPQSGAADPFDPANLFDSD